MTPSGSQSVISHSVCQSVSYQSVSRLVSQLVTLSASCMSSSQPANHLVGRHSVNQPYGQSVRNSLRKIVIQSMIRQNSHQAVSWSVKESVNQQVKEQVR